MVARMKILRVAMLLFTGVFR
jgi:hypothetical protein